MVATAGCGEWWAWMPLLLCAYGCAPSSRIEWLLTCEEGIVGTVWASVGVNAMQTFPSTLDLVGVVWVAFPAALAVVGWWSHRRFGE